MLKGLDYVIEFEIAAIVIFLVVMYYSFSGKNLPKLINQIYKAMLLVAFFAAVLNVISIICLSYSSYVPIAVNYTVNYLYLFVQNMVPPIWFYYMHNLTGEQEQQWKKYIYFIPVLIIVMSFIITPMTKFVFYFDEQGVYRWGPGMKVLFCCSIFYMVASVIVTMVYRKRLNRSQRFAVLFFVFANLSATIIQGLVRELMLIGFASAMSSIIMYITLQNPEEQLDYTTGIFNRTAALATINDYLKQGEPFQMVVLAIDQFRMVNEKYGFEAGDIVLRNLARFLNGLMPNCVYRLDGDNMAVIFPKNAISTEAIIGEIRGKFTQDWFVGDKAVHLTTCIGCISCPQDAQTVSEVLDTINNTIVDAKEIGAGTIIFASEHIENREKKIGELEEQKRLLENITMEAEAARIEAERADKTKSIFLANMSHEIRTPMNAILGMTELALREEVSTPVRDNLQNIKGAGVALLDIINDILDISKIESGKLEITEGRYSISSLIHDLTNIISSRLKDNKSVELLIELNPELPDVLYGDELRIRQILLNLLTNATKFTTKGYVKLVVSGEVKEDSVELNFKVEDTGFGMRKEDQEHMFESFTRFDNMKTRQIEGSGLGLAICKQLLDLMDGEIRVESEYGVGTTFFVKLSQKIMGMEKIMEIQHPELIKPLIILEDEKEFTLMKIMQSFHLRGTYETESEAVFRLMENAKFSHIFMSHATYLRNKEITDKLSENTRIVIITEYAEYVERIGYLCTIQKPVYCLNMGEALNGEFEDSAKQEIRETIVAPDVKVLIVDDNAVNLKVAEGLMKPYQLQISTAMSGRECLELVKSKQYDLIFLDHMMPEMDGIETLEHIRAMDDPYFKEVKIIILTANAIRGVREMFLEKGFNDYISKPININRLDEVLQRNIPADKVQKDKVKIQNKTDVFPYVIEQIDTKRGIENCSGSLKMYYELLRTVMLEGKIKQRIMEEYIDTDNIRSYMVEAHALKSVAASIGAMELSSLAKTQEEEAKAENYEYIRMHGKDLTEKYFKLLCIIEDVLAKAEAEEEDKNSSEKAETEAFDAKEKISAILELIESYEDEDAISELNYLIKNVNDKKIEVACKVAKEALQILDYETAKSRLEVLLKDTNY